jgi:hypothetical protein
VGLIILLIFVVNLKTSQMNREVLNSIKIINSYNILLDKFYKHYPKSTIQSVEISYNEGILSQDVINCLLLLAPPCYKIGEKVFLKGETKGNYDFIGDEIDYQGATEIYDMTEEIKSGNSYNFYVSSVEFFTLASLKEHFEVIQFLKNLN